MRRVAAALLFLVLASTNAWAVGLVARVDISRQTLTVYENGIATYAWPVSTARRGYRTPVGSYRPTRLHKMWYSSKYDNAPMPNSIFFKGGYAIHGTPHVRNLGRPASHGCIRLHPSNARLLYSLVLSYGRGNTRVVVQR
jgi:lipoprotein-anchoring transpeptidase ErfK/SrfK